MLLTIIALAAAAGAAQPAEPAADLRELAQDCSAHRFETVASAVVDGKLKRSKVKLCGRTGQSDADWLATLKDSAAKIAVNEQVAPAMRAEMARLLNAEVARLAAGGSATAAPAPGGFTLTPRQSVPTAPKATYTSLPPLPPPVVVEANPGAFVPPPPIVRPELRFDCFSTGTGSAEGPCLAFDRHTVVVVQARSPVGPGTSLRFVRDGAGKGEVALAALRKGQKQRIPLPSDVCRGVNGGRLEIETVVVPKAANAAPRVADSEGPFELSC